MRRRRAIALLGGAAVAASLAARAQQPQQSRRIGILIGSDVSTESRIRAIVEGLRELGWRDGENVRIERILTSPDPDQMRRAAADLAARAPDVIVANGTALLQAALAATRTIPIVFFSVSDPVALGVVASLAHPGGNVTGFANYEPAMASKWLELLKETDARLVSVAVLYNPKTAPFGALMLQTLEAAAANFSVTISAALVHQRSDLEQAISALAATQGSGLIVGPDNFTVNNCAEITALAARYRITAIYPLRLFAENGGLIVYGVDLVEQARRGASYVSRILGGENPAELPVQQPTKYEMIINLKTARALDLTIPSALLVQADEVIE
ncbi:MAG TPA: ABC transporter substrate-binding protein [Stellaceae bacterium]|nr:ABC transporter substrate-binding protein [Stellaceae bacterium]